MLNLNYDSRFDVLAITLTDNRNSVGTDEYDGMVIVRDRNNSNITSVLIYDFIKRQENNILPVLPKEISIDYTKDVLPYLKYELKTS